MYGRFTPVVRCAAVARSRSPTASMSRDGARSRKQLGETADLHAHPFLLELEVNVDGARQTVRSAEFLPQDVHMVAT